MLASFEIYQKKADGALSQKRSKAQFACMLFSFGVTHCFDRFSLANTD